MSSNASIALRNYVEGLRGREMTEDEKIANDLVTMLEEKYGEQRAQDIVWEMADRAMIPGHRGILENDD